MAIFDFTNRSRYNAELAHAVQVDENDNLDLKEGIHFQAGDGGHLNGFGGGVWQPKIGQVGNSGGSFDYFSTEETYYKRIGMTCYLFANLVTNASCGHSAGSEIFGLPYIPDAQNGIVGIHCANGGGDHPDALKITTDGLELYKRDEFNGAHVRCGVLGSGTILQFSFAYKIDDIYAL